MTQRSLSRPTPPASSGSAWVAFAVAALATTAPLHAVLPVLFSDGFEEGLNAWSGVEPKAWALTESFDGDPASPSQDLLPDNFDFVVTHRTHPRNHDPAFALFPADHGNDCAGPVPPSPTVPDRQHMVATSHTSNGANPDDSFFVCKNHMMSSMGHVEGYSVTSFWPRQEFDWQGGGTLEFEVNINDGHPRSWWEILLTPREQLKVGAAQDWLPIDETYPEDRIVLTFDEGSRRNVEVGSGALPPKGWQVEEKDWRTWRFIDGDDPALEDRRIRRTMRVRFAEDRIAWSIEMADGSFDDYGVDLPDGFPFTRGLVIFKTHAYTPTKDDNFDQYTFHWDELRFTGPVVGRYSTFEADGLAYLQANGSRPIGDRATLSITLPSVPESDRNPTLFGQLNGALPGQVELQINGAGPWIPVAPHGSEDWENCSGTGWVSFRLPLDSDNLVSGVNQFEWRVGPRPSCALEWAWDGFSVKGLEIQVDD